MPVLRLGMEVLYFFDVARESQMPAIFICRILSSSPGEPGVDGWGRLANRIACVYPPEVAWKVCIVAEIPDAIIEACPIVFQYLYICT